MTENELKRLYRSGKTIKELSLVTCMSLSTVRRRLIAAGCAMRTAGPPKGYKFSEEARKNMSAAKKGKMTEAQKKAISERNSCNYNGLNGYGHTKTHNRGYVLGYAPRHPNAHKDGYVMEHTLVMEMSLGRYLDPNEVVHHINRIRSDNRIENLVLMDSKEHCRMHMIERHRERGNGLSTAS